MDRKDYYAEYYKNNAEKYSIYYKGYNANRANQKRRHNRYLRDKEKKILMEQIETLKEKLNK